MRQHLLHMCDLTSGITRTLRLLPESRSPLLLQVCFRGNTRLRLLQSDPSVLRRFCDTDRLLSSARTRFAHPEFFRCWPVWGTPTGPETVRLSRGDGKWLARGQNGVLTPTGRCAPQDRNCGILRQMRWDGSTKAAAPSSGTYCASSCPRRAPGQHKMAWHPHLLGACSARADEVIE